MVMYGGISKVKGGYDKPKSIKKVALVIGNSNYKYIEKLISPKKDAIKMPEKLKSLGFDVTIKYNLDSIEMLAEVKKFKRTLEKYKNPIAFFYYSGHGSQVDKESYLIPINVDTTDSDNIRFRAIKVEEILKKISSARTLVNILFLDACRDIPTGTRGGNKGLGQVKNLTSGSLILYSTESGKTAKDSRLFNKVVLDKLSIPNKNLLALASDISNEVAKKTEDKQIPEVIFKKLPNVVLSEKIREPKKLALIIGNKDYKYIPELQNSVNDARDLASTLKEVDFDVTMRNNLNKNDTLQIMKSFSKKINKNDIVLFYFSGGGLQINGINYILPIDARIYDSYEVKYLAINTNQIISKIGKFNDKIIIYSTGSKGIASNGKGGNTPFAKSLIKYIKKDIELCEVIKGVRRDVIKSTNGKQKPEAILSSSNNFYFNRKPNGSMAIIILDTCRNNPWER